MAWPVMSKRYVPCTDLPRADRSRLADSIDRFFLWLERSRQRRRLGQLSNHMLKDIGLSRVDIEAELGKLPWQR